ncbi:hypothetical protein P3S68_002260 [Capsicum galapagoense]
MEIGLAAGGAFLSSALGVLFDRLAPDLLEMFQKNKHDVRLLKKLKMTLVDIQAVLCDAENKQASNQHVSQWLNELRDAVDGAENLMEQVNYEALSDLNLCLSDDFFLSIKEKLKDTLEALEDLQKQIGLLGLKEHFSSTKGETTTPSTSCIVESDVFGWLNEKNELIDRLLSKDDSEKSYCCPYCWNGGKIGSFDLKDDDNINRLQVKLKEKLNGKRFLIVLDDMWNDDYKEWDDLRNIFVQGDTGSKIIVTTRKESVALMMGSGAINVGTLSDEASWALFRRHSLENRDPMEHPELEEVGKNCSQRLKALMLSYNELPAHLKPCFSYCAIFPKDHPFRKEQVIHLWIANGLVVPRGDERIQDLGNQFFLELRSRSLFELVPDPFQGNTEEFLILDLINDLAQIASSKLCVRMEKLINLYHLDIINTSCLKKPLHLSKLKSLQVLVGANFLLGGSGGWRMEDLGEAHYLYGSLSILELHTVVDRREALKANTREKNHVEKLSLEWSESTADDSQTGRDILDELRPHSNIKELQIYRYRGTQFPNWLDDHSFLKLLIQLSLSNCKDCFSLPAPGQLPCLKSLSIRGMHRITEVTEEFYGSLSSKKPFNSLEKLEIAEMPKWKQWHIPGNGEFPTLKKLSISKCPEFGDTHPTFKELVIHHNGSDKVIVGGENWVLRCSIQSLEIGNLKTLSSQLLKSLTSLEYLYTDNLPQIQSLLEEGLLSSLSELHLNRHDELPSIPTEGLGHLTSLRRLEISNCYQLQSLAESGFPSSLSLS